MMKKITLLLALLVTSFGFSQTIDLLTNGDFENGTAPWVGAPFTVVAGEAFISTTNAGGNPWDTQLVHANLAFENTKEYVLTFYARAAANREITVAIQNVGSWEDQFRQNFSLTTTMTEFTATFNANSTNANVQIGFLMANFGSTDAIYYDDISLVTAAADTTIDATLSDLKVGTTTVTGFTPTVLDYSVLLLKGTTVAPTIAATTTNGSATTVITQAPGLPGDATVIVTAADGTTTETYTVSFTVDTSNNTPCAGTSTDALQGSFTLGYNYSFVTSGSNVTITFEMLDSFTGLNAQLHQGALFTGMSSSDLGVTWELTLTGQTPGAVISFSLYAAYAGGLVESKIFNYTVGDVCGTLGIEDLEQFNFSIYPNPANDVIQLKAAATIDFVEIYDILGRSVLKNTPNAKSKTLNVSGLSKGLYMVKVGIDGAIGTSKLLKQ